MDKVRFAIVGAGNIASVHVQAIEQIPEAEVSVVCSRTEASGRSLAESCGAAWVPDYHEAVARPDVDVVSVCTPSGSHAEIAEAAAAAGKHLLIEKPIEVTLPRADRIIRAARDAGVKLACVFPFRFVRGAEITRQALDAGRLGRMVFADAFVKWYRAQSYYDGTWRGTWELDGGGALMNQSIHSIDLLQWLAGSVGSVFAMADTLTHSIETEDTASAVLRYRNGAMGVIQGSTACWPGERSRVELRGERGTIVLEDGRIIVWQLEGAEPDEEERMCALESAHGSGSRDPKAIGSERHRRQIADLVEAVREDRQPSISGEEARKAVEIIRAIYLSASAGRLVELPLEDSAEAGPPR